MFVLVLTVKNGKSFPLRKSEKKRTRRRNNFPVKKCFSQREKTDGPCTECGAKALEMTPGENLGLFCCTQDLATKVKLERLTEKCRFCTV